MQGAGVTAVGQWGTQSPMNAAQDQAPQATIHGGVTTLCNRLMAMEQSLNNILDRLVNRPRAISGGNTEKLAQEPSTSDHLTGCHLCASRIEDTLTAIQQLIG